jgi:hypothetical protein
MIESEIDSVMYLVTCSNQNLTSTTTCLQRKRCKCLHNHDNKTQLLSACQFQEANSCRRFLRPLSSPHMTVVKYQVMHKQKGGKGISIAWILTFSTNKFYVNHFRQEISYLLDF